MADAHNGVHISSGVEISLELHPDRITGLDQIVKNAVGDFLMGDRAISIAVHVELDGFQLNNPRSRLIKKSQHSEIGKAAAGMRGNFESRPQRRKVDRGRRGRRRGRRRGQHRGRRRGRSRGRHRGRRRNRRPFGETL